MPDTHWAVKYINFAATRGWVTGYADGTFKPEHSITRAEVAAVTCRLLERSAIEVNKIPGLVDVKRANLFTCVDRFKTLSRQLF